MLVRAWQWKKCQFFVCFWILFKFLSVYYVLYSRGSLWYFHTCIYSHLCLLFFLLVSFLSFHLWLIPLSVWRGPSPPLAPTGKLKPAMLVFVAQIYFSEPDGRFGVLRHYLWLDPFSESFVPIWGIAANIQLLHHSPQQKVLVKPKLS